MREETYWSTPITNVIQLDRDMWAQYHREFIAFHELRREHVMPHLHRVVKWHKAVLGRQAYCFTGWRRYWVWEAEGHWRVFVNNTAGIGFEVNRVFGHQEARGAWHSYLRKMGAEETIGVDSL